VKVIAALTAWLLSATVGILVVSCGTAPVMKTSEEPKGAAKKCLECHPEFAERFSRGNVHAPVKEEDCYACHRPHGIYGKITFRADQPALCYSCHPAVQPKSTAKSVHQPLTGEQCTTCHNPHNSDYAGLLAGEGSESCFACHDRAGFSQQFVHAPLAQGCKTCHAPHSSENANLLQQAPDATCTSCHEVSQEGFSQAHFKYLVKTGCVLCHSPHSASAKGLLKKNVHDPVRKGQCDSCHTVGGNGELQPRPEPDKLCLQCHDITRSATSMHQPYVQGKCTTCHDVHASNYTDLLSDVPERICLTCHAAVAGMEKAAPAPSPAEATTGDKPPPAPSVVDRPVSQHRPVTEGKCLACHNGHVAEQKSMLKADPGKLCLDCHTQQGYTAAGGSHPAEAEQGCVTCHVPHHSKVRVLLRGERERDLCFGCHKTTAVERGRFSQHRPFAQGNCGGCHQLHQPGASGFLVEPYGSGKLCLTCHEESQKGAENFRSHAPVSQGQCSKCHSPHAADYDKILRQSEQKLCFACHQDVSRAHDNAAVQHKPLIEGKCTSCHTAHGSPYARILKQNQPKLCLACHPAVAEFWIEGEYHEPATKDCLQCHNSHGSDLEGMLVKPSGELCLQCHDGKSEAFSKAHNRITPRPESCVSCHSPHGSPVKSMLYPVVHKPFEERSCSPCHPGRKE
jgi:predicted CXXCH cytochrome family protein